MVKYRGQEVSTGDVVQLKVLFKNSVGGPTDLTELPQIQLVDPTNVVFMDYTSTGVVRADVGTYTFDLTVPLNGPTGIWTDNWTGDMAGDTVVGSFNFVVSNIPLDDSADGYEQLGDEPNYNLSPDAISNINRLMKVLRIRLKAQGRRQSHDGYGNIIYENCDIFSVDELYAFLSVALAEFNAMPTFTGFTFEDPIMVDTFAEVLVEGATIQALFAQAIIEKSREWNVNDNGVTFSPPNIGDSLMAQANSMLGPYREKLKYIKSNCKGVGLGLGTLRIASVAPQFMRLRHRRQGQFF